MASQPRKVSARDIIGDLAPKFTELTDKVLFEDVWERPNLSKRDRSLITVAALIAMNRTQQLDFHLKFGLENGITKDEMLEAITHLAFYSGWPTSMSAMILAKDIFEPRK